MGIFSYLLTAFPLIYLIFRAHLLSCYLPITHTVIYRKRTRFNIRILKYHEKQCFRDFLAKHKLDPDSSYKTENAYFELLNCLGY